MWSNRDHIFAGFFLVFQFTLLDQYVDSTPLPSAGTYLKYSPSDMDYDDLSRVVVTHDEDIIATTLTRTGHYKDITISVTAFRETFILDISLNRYLFASTYIEKAITNSREIYNKVNHIAGHCYYIGKVRNRADTTAAVSTCKGIVGYFQVGNTSYHIKPVDDYLLAKHKIYRSRGDRPGMTFGCGTHNDAGSFSLSAYGRTRGKSSRRMKRSLNWPQDQPGKIKVVELYVANDRSQYLDRGSDVNNVYSRTKDIVNIASSAYQAVDIYLVLVGVEVWTDTDRIPIQSSDATATLISWLSYRKTKINPFLYNDNAALITNVTFDTVVGKAFVGTMCSNAYSGSFVSDFSSLVSAVGTVLAHEMGHNFGLQHDDNYTTPCTCNDVNSKRHCIMYPSTDPRTPSNMWSDCSVEHLKKAFQQGLDICLYNIPSVIFQPSSTCGNGIVEDGEQCDCGNAPSSECNRGCCSSTNCRLTGSATCAFGGCCDIPTCQVKSSGTVCRSKTNDCDLSEYCNGVNFLCPADTYRPDGTDCTNGDTAYCYGGHCRSHLSQCELIWGSGTLVSDSLCYNLNKNGTYYANCGLKWLPNLTYIQCQDSDVMCGRLQCQENSRSLSYYKVTYLIARASIGFSTCHSVIFDFGLAVQDPGLVPNGAKCGEGMMCLNQSCVDVRRLATTRCRGNCQQDQVCNNVGECQSISGSSSSITSSTSSVSSSTSTTSSSTTSSATSSPTTSSPTTSSPTTSFSTTSSSTTSSATTSSTTTSSSTTSTSTTSTSTTSSSRIPNRPTPKVWPSLTTPTTSPSTSSSDKGFRKTPVTTLKTTPIRRNTPAGRLS